MAAPRVLGLLTVWLAAAHAASPCTSAHADDEDHAACYGWCSPALAEDHCGWCKCRGCGWCGAPDTSAAAITGRCNSGLEGDLMFADCQAFCSADQSEHHCPYCKCQACSFCSCSSEYEDDGTEARARYPARPRHRPRR